MSAYITKVRAKMHTQLMAVPDATLDALILAASAMIDDKYTITGTSFPTDTPADVQEAVVQVTVHLLNMYSVSERLGDWNMSQAQSTQLPSLVTLMLYPYKTPKLSPCVIKEDS